MEGLNVSRSFVRGLAITALIFAGCGGGGGGGKSTNDGGQVNGYNVNLSSLEISNGTLTPSFDQTITSYTVTVDTAVTSIKVKPAVVDDKAVITVNGSSVDSDSDSQEITLTPGVPEKISITVTAPDRIIKKTYTVEVLRQGTAPPVDVNLSSLSLSAGTLSPSFDPATVSYTATVGYGVSSVSVNAAAVDTKSSVKINGSTNKTIALAVGVNAITVKVTGYDGKTVKDYTISITRGVPSINANLSDLEISKGTLSPGFGASVYSYNASVAKEVSSVDVTPTAEDSKSTITVNGTTVTSGSLVRISLPENSTTTITVAVTAQDGKTRNSYVVNMTRAAKSPNANLSSLVISNGTLTPRFDPNTTFYRAEIATSQTSSTITPTVSFDAAIVSVNGTAVSSGSASSSIPLNIGINKASVKVTAEDGTDKTYSLELVRVPDKSKNAFLAGLYLSSGSLSPVFCKTKTAYTTEVASNITSITVTPSAAGLNAAVKVNNTAVITNNASSPITLSVGSNTITVEVWAEDISSYMKYVVTVTRLASGVTSSNADGAGLSTDGGTLTPAFDPSVTGYTLYTNESTYTVTPATAGDGSSVTVNGTAVTTGTTSVTIPSTTNATIVVTAADGTTKTYIITVVKDTTPPTAGTLRATKCDMRYINIAWTPASDDKSPSSDLSYAIYRSASNNISTIADAEMNGTLVKNYAKNISEYSVHGLSLDAGWYIAVVVKDGAGNKTIYSVLSARTIGVSSMASVAPNGVVSSIAKNDTTLYIGGAFTSIGYRSSNNALFNTITGEQVEMQSLETNSATYCVVADGEGGWYIGGSFTSVYGIAHNRIAHILSDGSLDEWNPNLNSYVESIAVNGTIVYAGGAFSTVGTDARFGLAAIDVSTGKATSWNPKVNSSVKSIVLRGTTLYAGGGFSTVGTDARFGLAAIDISTGKATSWYPNLNGGVDSIVVNGTTVYAGGRFTTVGIATRNNLVAIDISTGKATSWDPNVTGSVNSLAVYGTKIYVGGEYTAVGKDARSNLSAIDMSTGKATDWNPNVNWAVKSIAVNGSTVYAGGRFTTVGTDTRNYLAAIDISTGKATSWNPNVNNDVCSLAVSGTTICAGGYFNTVDAEIRNHLAAIDISTGKLTSWDPDVSSNVVTLVLRGTTIYAGGGFSMVGKDTRKYLAEIDLSTGKATSWDPNMNAYVQALAVSGSTIYVGGNFSKVGTDTRNRLAEIDLSTGKATSWDPNVTGDVFALAVNGTTIYAGGQFTTIGTDTRNNLAEIDVSTGKATSWNPDLNGYVRSIVMSGTTIYAGGQFTTIGMDTRNNLAEIDMSTGKATGWNPNVDKVVITLAVRGTTIYVGGYFTTVGTDTRNHLAAINVNTGKATNWNPNVNNAVYSLAVSGTTIYAGGGFSSVGELFYPYLAAIDATTGLPK